MRVERDAQLHDRVRGAVGGSVPLPATFTPLGTISSGLAVLDEVVAAGSDPLSDGTAKQPLTLTSVRVAQEVLTPTAAQTP